MVVLARALASPALMVMLSGFATTTDTTSNRGAATWLTTLIASFRAASPQPRAHLVQSGRALLAGVQNSFGVSSSTVTTTTLLLAEATANFFIGRLMVMPITMMNVVSRNPVKARSQDSDLTDRDFKLLD